VVVVWQLAFSCLFEATGWSLPWAKFISFRTSYVETHQRSRDIPHSPQKSLPPQTHTRAPAPRTLPPVPDGAPEGAAAIAAPPLSHPIPLRGVAAQGKTGSHHLTPQVATLRAPRRLPRAQAGTHQK
jgi:hypothetical protein